MKPTIPIVPVLVTEAATNPARYPASASSKTRPWTLDGAPPAMVWSSSKNWVAVLPAAASSTAAAASGPTVTTMVVPSAAAALTAAVSPAIDMGVTSVGVTPSWPAASWTPCQASWLGVPSPDSPTAEIRTMDATELVGAGVGGAAVGVAVGATLGVTAGPVGVGAGGLEKRLQPATRAAVATMPHPMATRDPGRDVRLSWRLLPLVRWLDCT